MAKAPSFKSVRAYLLLLGGLGVIIYEVVFEHTERPTVIVAALLMMGISVPLNLDEKLAWLAALTVKAKEPPVPPVPPAPPTPVAPPQSSGVT